MRPLFVVVVLLALAALGWWWTADTAVPVPPAPPEVTSPAGSAAPVVAGSPTSPPAGQADATGELAAERLRPQAGADASPANVRVVQFGSDVGVPGATVAFLRPDFDWANLTEAERRECQQLAGDLDALLRRFGGECTTDDAGGCRVPIGPNGTSVKARSGTLYAQGYLGQDPQKPLVLTLREDRTLHVLVVDSAGRPVPGISVQVELPATGVAKPTDRQVSAWGFGPTDAAGRCTYAHLQQLAGEAATLPLVVSAKLPGGSSDVVRIEATDPPDEVTLHLPVTGSVTVHLGDVDGKPLDVGLLGDADVQLAVLEGKPADGRAGRTGFDRIRTTARLGADATARFANVLLDRWIAVSSGFGGETVTVEGPTLANPSVEVSLRESRDDVIVTGTLLQPDRAPFAMGSLQITFRADGSMGTRTARTDAQGRMRCNLSSYAKGEQGKLSLATSESAGESNSADGVAVEMPPRALHAGLNDLGELQLAPVAILVAGRLRCDDGITATQVQFDVQRMQGQQWQQEWNLRPKWLDGTFSLRAGIPAGEPLRLVVRDGAYLPVEPIECKAGDTDVEIHLRAAGVATATFLVDDRTPLNLLSACLEPEIASKDDDGRQDWQREMRSRFDAAAEDGHTGKVWPGLVPGRYRLTVACQGSGEPFVTIDAIEITAGPCTDPRLRDIDLRGRARSLAIRATGRDGGEVVDGDAFVLVMGKGQLWNGYNLRTGTATIAATGSVDVMVLAKGYEMARVVGVSSSCAVPLQSAQTASLSLALPSPLPEGVQVRLRLRPRLDLPKRVQVTLDTGRGMGLESLFVEEFLLDAVGAVEVPVRWPGEYTAQVMLVRGERKVASLRRVASNTFTLPATVVLRVSQQDYDEALERLAK